MDFPTNLSEGSRVMQDFSASGELAKLPDFTKEKVMSAMSELSMADQMVKFGEAIYANAANVNSEARNAAAKVIALASGLVSAIGPYHGLQNEDRGARMVAALRRRNGHVAPANSDGWPPASEDPAPIAEMVEPEESDEGAEPEGPEGPEA